MSKRRVTKPVYVGGVKIGGGADVTVQSMTKTDTRDVKATVKQIHELEEAGCELIRSAVPDADAAEAMAEIKKQIHIPLIADIHFHYKLALTCLEGGIDCLRLNPGNLRNEDQVREVVRAAKARNVPIRIGVNFGSLPPVGGIGRTSWIDSVAVLVQAIARDLLGARVHRSEGVIAVHQRVRTVAVGVGGDGRG